MSSESKGGVGFFGLLTIAFIALKIAKVIDWNWIWVLSPLWLGTVIAVGIMAMAVLGAVVLAEFE